MSEQYIVAALLDGTMNITACGPYKSRQKAESVSDILQELIDEHPDPIATGITQVVRLDNIRELSQGITGS